MASAAFSVEHVSLVRRVHARPAAPRRGRPTTLWSWRAAADAGSAVLFFGLLGWETWRIGGVLLELGVRAASAAGGLF